MKTLHFDSSGVLALHLTQTQTNTVTLAPEIRQFMKLLQMSTHELDLYVQSEVTENPMFELDSLSSHLQSDPWAQRPASRKKKSEDSDDTGDIFDYLSVTDWDSSFRSHLMFQLSAYRLSPLEHRICSYLIACVDDRGYLTESSDEIAQLFSASGSVVDSCFDLLKSFSPAGACARDLRECLLMQLDEEENPLAGKIIRSYLRDLSQGHYSLIAKELACSVKQVKSAVQFISSLEPKPSAGFSSATPADYIIPDVILHRVNGTFRPELTRSWIPDLVISPTYLALLKQEPEHAILDYLSERLRAAEALIRNIRQRDTTLLLCSQAVVNFQTDFFQKGGELKPMKLTDIADELDCHPSTVSRALSAKYMQCDLGIFPFRYFFSHRISSDSATSADSVQQMIRELIDREDKAAPLSDRQICDRLARRQIRIARRTVAKYREQLNIPSTLLRKREKPYPD